MLYLDTCVVLALLTLEVNTQAATAFVEQATEMLAINPGRPPNCIPPWRSRCAAVPSTRLRRIAFWLAWRNPSLN